MENQSPTTTEHPNEITGVDNSPTTICSFENTEQAAIAYAKSGLSVLPVKQDKSPALSSSEFQDVKSSIAPEEEIKTWYTPTISGVAILCGSISRNVECVDVDEKHNIDPMSLLNRLTDLVQKEAPGLIARLVHETSVNNGHHFAYRCRTIGRSTKLARRAATDKELEVNPKEKSFTLIETRGEGGYFACYPTPGYKLLSGSFLEIPEITEEERNILLRCAKALNQLNPDEKVVNGYPKKKSPSMTRPGDDFNQRGEIQPILRDAGWNYVYSVGQTQYWRRPGKTVGISASFNNHPNMFYVFSSNADPLEPETWYTKFALVGLLLYEGNFRAAAQDLAEEGYGDTTVAQSESYLDQYYDFRFNVVTGRVEYSDKGKKAFVVLQDYDLNSICRKLQHSHIRISADGLAKLLNSDYANPFDPFREYYENLPKWDTTTDFISQLASTVTLKDATDENKKTFAQYLRKWLIATAGCAITDAVVNHTCLTLVGPQGRYKTTWLNRLVPKSLSSYIHVGTIDPTDKDTKIHLSECFLINLDELETLNKHELGSLKSILTYQSSRLRRPYGHFADQLIRRASFVGSINRDNFLTDETGTRRFLVFEIESIDAAHTVDMDKVHAQAYSLFKSGERYWFDTDETTKVNERNVQFSVQTTEDELVKQYCSASAAAGDDDWLSATQVAEGISKLAKYPMGKASARDFGFALRKAGFEKKKLDGITRYAVRVPEPPIPFPYSVGVNSGTESGVTYSFGR